MQSKSRAASTAAPPNAMAPRARYGHQQLADSAYHRKTVDPLGEQALLAHKAHERHPSPPCTLSELVESVYESSAKKLNKRAGQRLAEACYAGMFIALAFVFYLTVTTGGGTAPWGMVRLLGALVFSMGLMLVVLLQVELFTGTVLSSMPFMRGAVSLPRLLSVWTQVFVGNAVGAIGLAFLILFGGVWQLNGGQWGIQVLVTALNKLHHSTSEAFFLGVLCNFLVCLGIWLTHLSRSALAKAALLMLPVALFVSSGFEHSIANLFLLPLAWMLVDVMPQALLISHGLDGDALAHLTLANMLFANLLPVTLGNIVGGALLMGAGFLGVARLSHSKTAASDKNPVAQPNEPAGSQSHAVFAHSFAMPACTAKVKFDEGQAASSASLTSPFNQENQSMNRYLSTLTVSSLAEPVVCIERNLSLWQALKRMNDEGVACCAVVAGGGRLVGMLSLQDVLRGLWAEEYCLDSAYVAGELMSQTLTTVSPDDSLLPLIEFWAVDRDKLFPVSTEGHWLGGQYRSYEERLRDACASTPSILPIVEAGVVQGMVRRERLLSLMTEILEQAAGIGSAAEESVSDKGDAQAS